MRKKQLLFMIINMNVGGTEKALLNMLEQLPPENYNITLLMLEEYGGFMNQIPRHVTIEYVIDYPGMKELINKPLLHVALRSLKKWELGKFIKASSLYIGSKLLQDRTFLYQTILKDYPQTAKTYDIAVAYAGPMDFISYFVLKKIKAANKLQWVHFDITKIGFNCTFASKMYPYFDKIYAVSKQARNNLVHALPHLEEKTAVFYNLVSAQSVMNQSREGRGFSDPFEGIRILTIGRLSIEKGQDLAIRALDRLIQDGYKVKWYCVGEGSSRKELEKLIAEFDLQEHFILLGSNPNPYPYLAQCDLYVQPSRHEGYCITLNEARCLNKPIVTTDFNGAREQITDGSTGSIVAINEYEIYIAVKQLLDNPALRSNYIKNLANDAKRNATSGIAHKIIF